VQGAQRQGSYPREDWQLDFPYVRGSKLLLVFVDTFAGWVEAFPCSTERATEVFQVLTTEIILALVSPKAFKVIMGLI
jgi:hypothetical protein